MLCYDLVPATIATGITTHIISREQEVIARRSLAC